MKPLTIFLIVVLGFAFWLFMRGAGNIGLSLNNVTSTGTDFGSGVAQTFVAEVQALFKSIFNPSKVLAGVGIGQS